VGGVREQRYKQRQSAVAHVIIVYIHGPVLSSLKMKGIRFLGLSEQLPPTFCRVASSLIKLSFDNTDYEILKDFSTKSINCTTLYISMP
jgi:hypothetical protein